MMDCLQYEINSEGLYRVTVDVGDGNPKTVNNVLFLTKFGSHLHGTTTPTSDMDMKAIYREDLESIILGTDKETRNITTGGNDRNTSDDLDIEFIELRKFIRDAMKGQTYAVEMLHANKESVVLSTDFFAHLNLHRDKLLTSNVKPFIGYCVAQAKKYGLKGARLKATEDALEFLLKQNQKERIEDIIEKIPKNKYVFIVKKDLEGQDDPIQLLEINAKQFDMRVKLQEVTPIVQKLVNKYGNRAHKAKVGVDWKAVGHAYRCIYELEELLHTGKIVFPLKDREYLLAIKTGKVAYEQVQEELPQLIEQVKDIQSDLPEKPDRDFWDTWLVKGYLHN